MERGQFTFYASFAKAAERIRKKADRCDFYDAVKDYAIYGKEPEWEALSDTIAVAFELVRPTLDASKRKAENGKRGGAASKPEAPGSKPKQSASKPKANRSKSKQPASEKEGEKENEVEGEKESEIENECLKILPPGGGNTKSPAAAAGVSSISSAVAMVQADYLNRVNATASPASLDELAGFVEAMGPDVCRRAFDIALDERITRWSYIRGILQDKQQRGVKCLADWDALDGQRQKKRRDGAFQYDYGDMGGSL